MRRSTILTLLALALAAGATACERRDPAIGTAHSMSVTGPVAAVHAFVADQKPQLPAELVMNNRGEAVSATFSLAGLGADGLHRLTAAALTHRLSYTVTMVPIKAERRP